MNILTKFKDLTVESLKDNKKLIVGLYIIFIVCFIIGWIYAGFTVDNTISNMKAANTGDVGVNSNVGAMSILINNEAGGIFTYIGSVVFAIPAIIMLIYNGVNIGAVGPLFDALLPNGGVNYILYLIPHGIFEITAAVLESVAGILLFLFIWRFIKAWISSRDHSGAFNQTKNVLIQSIVIFVFSAILLIIAAPLEAYFSVPFADFIMHMF